MGNHWQTANASFKWSDLKVHLSTRPPFISVWHAKIQGGVLTQAMLFGMVFYWNHYGFATGEDSSA